VYKGLFIAILYLISVGCAPYEVGINTIEPPVPRDHPSNKIKVIGSKPADFEINISIRFVTTNRQCRKPVNLLEGAYSGGSHYVSGSVNSSITGYEAEVFLDSVEPGWCQWRPFTINYHVRKTNADQLMPHPPSPLVWFTKDGRPSLPQFEVECEQGPLLGRQNLFCTQPLGRYFILDSATVLNVSFVERTWRGQSPKKTR
jgi:hypothetical protein